MKKKLLVILIAMILVVATRKFFRDYTSYCYMQGFTAGADSVYRHFTENYELTEKSLNETQQ